MLSSDQRNNIHIKQNSINQAINITKQTISPAPETAPNPAETYLRSYSQRKPHELEFFSNRFMEFTLTANFIARNNKIIAYNQMLADLFQCKDTSLIGEPVDVLLGLNTSTLNPCLDAADNPSNEKSLSLCTTINRHGETRWLNCMISPVSYGASHLVLGSVLEITDQMRSSALLHKAHKQVARLESRLIQEKEDERKRIALELHDGISQNLSVIKLKLETYLKAINNKPAQTHALGNNLVGNIQATIEELRNISMNLYPTVLNDFGVITAVERLCRETQNAHNNIVIGSSFNIDERQIPQELKIIIYRIAQEALQNILKHANAAYAHVHIALTAKGIRLNISDNGRGFSYKSNYKTKERGMGLGNMHQRAKTSGGRLRILAKPQAGVSVHVFWPRDSYGKSGRNAGGNSGQQTVFNGVGCQGGCTV